MNPVKKIIPILDHILVTDINFGEQVTSGGIVLRSDNGKSEGVKPRWGCVYAVGPEQKDVKAGDWLLIEHGRWTRSIEIPVNDDDNIVELYRIDPNGILLISDEKPNDIEFGSYSTPTQSSVSDYSF